MKILKNNLTSPLKYRTEKNWPIKGIEFIDITPMFMDIKLFSETVTLLAEDIKKLKVDYIVGPEARGFILAAALSEKLGIPFIPVRKKGKLPPTTVETTIEYEKEYGKDYLQLPKLTNDEYSGKNYYLVDDILATGSTFKAIENAIVNLGGEVVGKGVILNIVELNQLPIFSLIDINEEVIHDEKRDNEDSPRQLKPKNN